MTEVCISPPQTMMELYKILPEGTRVQLINNKLIMSPAPLYVHFSIEKAIFRQLDLFVEKHKLGEVVFAPVDVYLDNENVYQPDIFFISNERKGIIKKDGIHGAPDLVIEILSPSNKRDDTVKKKEVYQKAGVKEYWYLDPETKTATGFLHSFVVTRNLTGEIIFNILDLTVKF
jgi:Uma2 family endonuclease